MKESGPSRPRLLLLEMLVEIARQLGRCGDLSVHDLKVVCRKT